MDDSSYTVANVANKIIIADRGGEAVKDKVLRFLNLGASGVIVLNAVTNFSRGDAWTHPIMSFDHLTIPEGWAISLSRTNGLQLLEMIKNDQALEVEFKPEKLRTQLLANTGISGFSSFGPNYDLELKPDLVAPGENILSTGHRGYVNMNGTSMASPHIAGLSTLLLQKSRQIDDDYIRSMNQANLTKIMLMNTANVLLDKDGLLEGEEALPYLPRRQGAGQANLLAAFGSKVLLTHDNKGSISLKEIGDISTFTLKVYNFSDEIQTFSVSSSPVLVQSLKNRTLEMEDNNFPTKTFHSKILDSALVKTPLNVTVAPHSFAYLPIELRVEEAHDEFVEGYIYLTAKDGNHPPLNIPYLGFKGEYNKELIIDKPQWEEESLTKQVRLRKFVKEDDHTRTFEFTDLGSKKEGTDIDDPATYSVNSETSGIHGSSIVQKVAPVLVFLRDTYLYEVAIVKEATAEAPALRILDTAHFPEKYIENKIQEYGESYRDTFLVANPAAIWDGWLYDATVSTSSESRMMKSAPEGQYYYRIRAKKSERDEWQNTYIPIRVDNTKPSVTASVNRDSREVTLNVSDNNGVEFIGATLNHRPLKLKKTTEETYSFSLPEDNLTTSYLSVEAMDYAGNPISLHTHLAKDYLELINRASVLNKSDNKLKIKLNKGATLDEVRFVQLDSANKEVKEEIASVKRIDDEIHISTENSESYNNIAISYNVDGHSKVTELFSLRLNNNLEAHAEDDNISDSSNEEDEDEENSTSDSSEDADDSSLEDEDVEEDTETNGTDSSIFHQRHDVDIINGLFLNHGIAIKHAKVDSDEDDTQLWKYKAYVWLREGQEAWLTMLNTHYNRINNKESYELLADENGDKIFKIEGPSGDDFEEILLPLKNGDNSIKLRVFDTNQEANAEETKQGFPGKQIYENKYLIFFDAISPEVSLGSNVELNEDDLEDYQPGNSIHGKIYTQGKKGIIRGTVSDDLDEWSLKINGDVIKRGGLKGHFGNNQKDFSYSFLANQDEYVHLIARDSSNNERKFELRIVEDATAPSIEVEDEENITVDNELNITFDDNITPEDELIKSIKINKQEYSGGAISTYALTETDGNKSNYYLIKIEVSDKAGNKTEKTIHLGEIKNNLIDTDLKKNTFTLKELDNIDNLFTPVENITFSIIEKTKISSNGTMDLKVLQSNQYGLEKIKTYTVKIVSETSLTEDVSLMHELKKDEYTTEELKNFKDLFELRTGISYTIDEKVDLSKLSQNNIVPLTVTFYSANAYYSHTYNLTVKYDEESMKEAIREALLNENLYNELVSFDIDKYLGFNISSNINNKVKKELDNVPQTASSEREIPILSLIILAYLLLICLRRKKLN